MEKAASIAKDAAPYMHPRLAAVEVTGKNGGPIQTQEVRDMSDAELDAELARYGLKS